MSIFQQAKNQQAFIKMGIYGNAGTGKTFTASLIAIGAVKELKSDKPVYFFDTETGSDYVAKRFEQEQIKLLTAKTRSFADLLNAMAIAEKEASVLIIDSVTHVWEELKHAWETKLNRDLQFQDWRRIKPEWQQFTDAFLNSNLHIIVCGREQDIWSVERDERGRMSPVQTGETRMKTEKEMSYEPAFMMHMERLRNNDGAYVHRATVTKDRSDQMDGKEIDDPTFESFRPFWNYLNIGGEHVGIDTTRNSQNLVTDPDKSVTERIRRRKVAVEEIQNALTEYIPGLSAKDKQEKIKILKKVFGTASWVAITEDWKAVPLEALEGGLEQVRKLAREYVGLGLADKITKLAKDYALHGSATKTKLKK